MGNSGEGGLDDFFLLPIQTTTQHNTTQVMWLAWLATVGTKIHHIGIIKAYYTNYFSYFVFVTVMVGCERKSPVFSYVNEYLCLCFTEHSLIRSDRWLSVLKLWKQRFTKMAL